MDNLICYYISSTHGLDVDKITKLGQAGKAVCIYINGEPLKGIPNTTFIKVNDQVNTINSISKCLCDNNINYDGIVIIETGQVTHHPTGEFDPVYYMNTYPDIVSGGFSTPALATRHWEKHGKTEGRYGSKPLTGCDGSARPKPEPVPSPPVNKPSRRIPPKVWIYGI